MYPFCVAITVILVTVTGVTTTHPGIVAVIGILVVAVIAVTGLVAVPSDIAVDAASQRSAIRASQR